VPNPNYTNCIKIVKIYQKYNCTLNIQTCTHSHEIKNRLSDFGRPFVKRFAIYAIKPLCVLSVLSCPVCLSVTLVYCGQTVGWIKMKLGVQVGLGHGHIVLDGDPAPFPKKGRRPLISGPCLLWPNGWMDQDVTWHGGGPRSRPHCGRWRPSYPAKKGGRAPNFRPISIVAKRLHASRCHLLWR